jgi:hypothetical protein
MLEIDQKSDGHILYLMKNMENRRKKYFGEFTYIAKVMT